MKRTDSQHDPGWDNALERKLDVALGDIDLPAGLSERIVAQTREHLPRRRSVLARLGGSPLRLAAAIAIVVGLGAMFYITGNPARRHTSPVSVASITTQLDQLALLEKSPDTPVDQQIDAIRMQLASVQSTSVWDDSRDVTDDAIAQPMAMPTMNAANGARNY